MTSPTLKRGKKKSRPAITNLLRLSTPLTIRRFSAWAIELSLLAASAWVPHTIGDYINSHSVGNKVPLNPVLVSKEEAVAKVFALPRQLEPQPKVPPLTNLLWWVALVTPVAWGGYQIYLLATTGQTTPKKWLGVRVIKATEDGEVPGWQRVIWREAVGRWGVAGGTAYFIWRFSGAFPATWILLGLTGIMFAAESAYYFLDEHRRTLHDRIGATSVVEADSLSTPEASETEEEQLPTVGVIEVHKNIASEIIADSSQEGTTTIVFSTSGAEKEPITSIWQWMRHNPGASLIIVAGTAMGAVLATFVGTQIYIQGQTNYREFSQQNNEAFLTLVQQLSSTSKIEERRAAILALARLDDPRAAPMLVDLLGQERHPALVETIQQALVGTGLGALPPLRHLNQALTNDRSSLLVNKDEPEQKILALRIRASQRAIAKLVAIHNGKVSNTDLSRTHLSPIDEENADFKLVWNYLNLAGINFRGSIMSHASLRGSTFSGAGADRRLGTFDDLMADLSGADLHDADLSGANLSNVSINNTNLIRASLNRANLKQAVMKRVNLSSASLVGANLEEAVLSQASLTGANLGEANFVLSNLQEANLGKADAPGANFSSANLRNSNWQGANIAKANFHNANLRNADLSATTLTGANLRNARLQNANLANANLNGADLRGVNLNGVNLEGVTFTSEQSKKADKILQATSPGVADAKISGVNFAPAQNVSESQLEFICSHKGLHPDCQ